MNSLCGITAWHHLCPTYQLCCHGKHDELLLTYFRAARRTPAGTLSSVSNAHRQKHQRHCDVSINPTNTTHIKSQMLGIIPARCGIHSEMTACMHTHLNIARTHATTCQSSSHHTTSLSLRGRALLGGVDSEGCFINPARVHLPLPHCFGMKGSDDPGIFRSLCSIELTTSP